jgi:precorrin-6A/cobalt-precorrin-6A reductase
MKPNSTTLVMAGAREAHGLVSALTARGRRVIASLPEEERVFDSLPVPTRVGGFSDAAAFEAWLLEQHVSTVFDASHAFDSEISAMAGAASTHLGLRYLRILRPPWVASHLDLWRHASSIPQAMEAFPSTACVFSNTGWMSVPDYAGFPGRKVYLRQTHRPTHPPPFAFMEFVEGHPPFSQFDEQRLFERLGITHLICRNVGGAASMSKLLAARAMALPVVMIARTPMPAHLPIVETVAEALAWEANA